MYKTIELTEDLAYYFNIPRYTSILFTLDMYRDFKRSLYETGNPSVIDDLDTIEHLLKDLNVRQKKIAGLMEYSRSRKRIGYSLGTSLSTVKRDLRDMRDMFSRVLSRIYAY